MNYQFDNFILFSDMIEKEVAEKFPLHYHVWQNDYLALEELLLQKTVGFVFEVFITV